MSAIEPAIKADTAILRAVGVSAGYGGIRGGATVLHDVDLDVLPGETLGVVGESGSGKSTLARVLVGQLKPAQGSVLLDGVDIGSLNQRMLRGVRRQIQLIPQDPYASLDPRMSIRGALEEAIDPRGGRRDHMGATVAELLRTVALDPGVADRRPHEFSGGQRQRIAIARALAVKPKVIIADEVTSSLDSSVQAEILNLLRDIQDQTGVAMIFITHDLSVANYMCDEICVLYLGRIVEQGSSRLLYSPDHPYTALLVQSIPRVGVGSMELLAAPTAPEEAADPSRPPSGCPFHPRCPCGPRTHPDREVCATDRPLLLPRWPEGSSARQRLTACHFPLATAPVDSTPRAEPPLSTDLYSQRSQHASQGD